MTRAIRSLFLMVGLVLVSRSAGAQLVNGDFEMGGLGWGAGGPVTWSYSYPPTGGNPNGNARLASPMTTSGGQTCITQQFFCGSAPGATTQCSINVQYLLDNLGATSQTARVRILLDGVEQHVSPPSDHIDWTDVAFSVPCGSHQIALCLQVDAGDNAWEARFDNAEGECTGVTPTRPRSWGRLKILYR